MIKSQYSDPKIDGHGFVNHLHSIVRDMGVIPGTTTPLIEAYKIEMIQNLAATAGTGGKPRNLALFRKVIAGDPSTGVWGLIKMWTEGADYDDASAAGSVDVLPDGTLHIVMSFGKRLANGALQFQPWEASVARNTFAAPIERLPPGGAQGEKGDPGPPGPAFLDGVTQGEPGAIEVKGGSYAYVDLSIAGDTDFGFRLIRTSAGAEIHVRGRLAVRTDRGVTEL